MNPVVADSRRRNSHHRTRKSGGTLESVNPPLVMLTLLCRVCKAPWSATREAWEASQRCPFCGSTDVETRRL